MGDALVERRKKKQEQQFQYQWIMRLACAILLLVGARAAGVAPAETLASAVPAEKKNPIDAVEATYGRVKQRWRDFSLRDYLKPKPKAADAPADAAKPAEKSAKPTEEPAPEKPKKPENPYCKPSRLESKLTQEETHYVLHPRRSRSITRNVLPPRPRPRIHPTPPRGLAALVRPRARPRPC